MSLVALARRSGVSLPTVRRILGDGLHAASFANVAAVAEALGAPLTLAARDVDEERMRQAQAKAEQVARLVQGTSALENQAVDQSTYRRLVERSVHELLAGSNRRLWGE